MVDLPCHRHDTDSLRSIPWLDVQAHAFNPDFTQEREQVDFRVGDQTGLQSETPISKATKTSMIKINTKEAVLGNTTL